MYLCVFLLRCVCVFHSGSLVTVGLSLCVCFYLGVLFYLRVVYLCVLLRRRVYLGMSLLRYVLLRFCFLLRRILYSFVCVLTCLLCS